MGADALPRVRGAGLATGEWHGRECQQAGGRGASEREWHALDGCQVVQVVLATGCIHEAHSRPTLCYNGATPTTGLGLAPTFHMRWNTLASALELHPERSVHRASYRWASTSSDGIDRCLR